MQAYTALILAGQRPGKVDPLAERAGVSHKCFVPIQGKPLIEWVLDVVAALPGVTEIRISIEGGAATDAEALAARIVAGRKPVRLIPAHASITDSLYAAAEGVTGPILVTTADNVNVSAQAVAEIMAPIALGADVTLGLATREAVLAARGETVSPATAHVGPYRFRDGAFSNCNIYAFSGPHVLRAAETFREGGQFSKDRGRLIRAVGLFNVALMAAKLLTLPGAMRRLSGRFGVKLEAVLLSDGAQAVDVDNFRTYALAETLLARRGQAAPAK